MNKNEDVLSLLIPIAFLYSCYTKHMGAQREGGRVGVGDPASQDEPSKRRSHNTSSLCGTVQSGVGSALGDITIPELCVLVTKYEDVGNFTPHVVHPHCVQCELQDEGAGQGDACTCTCAYVAECLFATPTKPLVK